MTNDKFWNFFPKTIMTFNHNFGHLSKGEKAKTLFFPLTSVSWEKKMLLTYLYNYQRSTFGESKEKLIRPLKIDNFIFISSLVTCLSFAFCWLYIYITSGNHHRRWRWRLVQFFFQTEVYHHHFFLEWIKKNEMIIIMMMMKKLKKQQIRNDKTLNVFLLTTIHFIWILYNFRVFFLIINRKEKVEIKNR